MAQITLTIPDDRLADLVSALCDAEGLPRSNANAKAALMAHLRRVYVSKRAAEINASVEEDRRARIATEQDDIETVLK